MAEGGGGVFKIYDEPESPNRGRVSDILTNWKRPMGRHV